MSIVDTAAKLIDSGGVRRFSDARIQAAVDSALAEAKPTDQVVVVAHHVYGDHGTQNITKLSLLVRLPQGFSVAAGAFKDWTKDDVGAEGKIVWRK